jgi:hypothetical protein
MAMNSRHHERELLLAKMAAEGNERVRRDVIQFDGGPSWESFVDSLAAEAAELSNGAEGGDETPLDQRREVPGSEL